MNNIPPIAWVFVAFIVIFTISINIWLFSSKNKKINSKNNHVIVSRMIKSLKDPFAEENNNLRKLSEATSNLREKNMDQKE